MHLGGKNIDGAEQKYNDTELLSRVFDKDFSVAGDLKNIYETNAESTGAGMHKSDSASLRTNNHQRANSSDSNNQVAFGR